MKKSTLLMFVAALYSSLSAQYYVSPTGSDSYDGTSVTSPFKTLDKARDAMRSSSTDTTYLMGGTYARAELSLGSEDAGTSWFGYHGQIPVLDGENSLSESININGADGVTIRWITIKNYVNKGINISWSDDITIDSDSIIDIASTDWNNSGLNVYGDFRNGRITHNYFRGMGYGAIELNFVEGHTFAGTVVEHNEVYDCQKFKQDGGGIYIMDRGHSYQAVRIANNVIGNFGSAGQGETHGIYLDDMVSNVTVENNIIWGSGWASFMVHGGDDNVIRNNIVDISVGYRFAGAERHAYLYQKRDAGTSMSGNEFTCNIVYSSTNVDYVFQNWAGAGYDKPAVSDNLYWQTSGNPVPLGDCDDSNPHRTDPGFVDAANHDYSFADGNSPLSCFTPIDISTVGPLPNDGGVTALNGSVTASVVKGTPVSTIVNGVLQLTLTPSSAGPLSLHIFSPNGRCIETVDLGNLDTQHQTFSVPLRNGAMSGLGSGLIICSIQNGNTRASQKFTIMR